MKINLGRDLIRGFCTSQDRRTALLVYADYLDECGQSSERIRWFADNVIDKQPQYTEPPPGTSGHEYRAWIDFMSTGRVSTTTLFTAAWLVVESVPRVVEGRIGGKSRRVINSALLNILRVHRSHKPNNVVKAYKEYVSNYWAYAPSDLQVALHLLTQMHTTSSWRWALNVLVDYAVLQHDIDGLTKHLRVTRKYAILLEWVAGLDWANCPK